MTLPDLVTDLPTSQRLKELGVPQKAYFEWHDGDLIKVGSRLYAGGGLIGSTPPVKYSAYTLSELIELLGDQFGNLRQLEKAHWRAIHPTMPRGKIQIFADGKTPLEACANLLIQLLEDGTLSFKS